MAATEYRHPMPDVQQLSSAELALHDHIIALHHQHEKLIGKVATLKNRPEYEVRVTEVIKSDYGIARLHFDVIKVNGEPVKQESTWKWFFNQMRYPSCAFEGSLIFSSK